MVASRLPRDLHILCRAHYIHLVMHALGGEGKPSTHRLPVSPLNRQPYPAHAQRHQSEHLKASGAVVQCASTRENCPSSEPGMSTLSSRNLPLMILHPPCLVASRCSSRNLPSMILHPPCLVASRCTTSQYHFNVPIWCQALCQPETAVPRGVCYPILVYLYPVYVYFGVEV